MGLAKKFFNNTRKPVGFLGNLMVSGMNSGHGKVSDWGMSNLPELEPLQIIDLGCGGGRNVSRLLKLYPHSQLTGLDYSEVSVKRTSKLNRKSIEKGICRIIQGDVSNLPMADGSFDLATAFETIYFWPGPEKSFAEVFRVLKSGGNFMIVNESDGNNEADQKWVDMIEGMKIYEEIEIVNHLKSVGFDKVDVFRKEENHWICFIAHKA